MKKVIATEAAVHAALDQLDRLGQKPTQRAVIDALGGGSFSSVTKHTQTWQPKNQPIADFGPVPDSIALQARQLVGDLWTLSAIEAEKHASERVLEIEAKLRRSETNREELAGILDEFTTKCEMQQAAASERDEWKARCASIQAERDALHRIVDTLSSVPKMNRRLKAKRMRPNPPEATTTTQT